MPSLGLLVYGEEKEKVLKVSSHDPQAQMLSTYHGRVHVRVTERCLVPTVDACTWVLLKAELHDGEWSQLPGRTGAWDGWQRQCQQHCKETFPVQGDCWECALCPDETREGLRGAASRGAAGRAQQCRLGSWPLLSRPCGLCPGGAKNSRARRDPGTALSSPQPTRGEQGAHRGGNGGAGRLRNLPRAPGPPPGLPVSLAPLSPRGLGSGAHWGSFST